MRPLSAWQAQRRERVVASQIHLLAVELAAHVRAGRTLAQSIGDVADDLPEPIRASVSEVRAAVELGMPPADALSRLRGGDDAAVLASAVSVQLRVGGDLATLLEGLGEALVERDAQRRAAQVATAQARATARMVASMPPFALAGLALVDSAAFSALLHSPIGLAAVLTSAALTAAGLLAISKLASVGR
jgi:tight adherence protein B